MNVVTPSSASTELQNAPTSAPDNWLAVAREGIDLRRLVLAFRRRLRLFAAVAIAVFVAALLVTLQATPKYTATANVMLDTRKERISNVEEVLSGLPADSG